MCVCVCVCVCGGGGGGGSVLANLGSACSITGVVNIAACLCSFSSEHIHDLREKCALEFLRATPVRHLKQ